MKLAAVWWKDAHGDDDAWLHPGRPRDDAPFVVLTVGHLLSRRAGKKRGHVSVARSVTQDGSVDAVLHIPRRMVLRVTPLGSVDGKTDLKSSEVVPPSWSV